MRCVRRELWWFSVVSADDYSARYKLRQLCSITVFDRADNELTSNLDGTIVAIKECTKYSLLRVI